MFNFILDAPGDGIALLKHIVFYDNLLNKDWLH
jgi:hypothetical protein